MILENMWIQILQDALFSAIAAIGFASISRPPARIYPYCGLIAALGHSIRFFLMNPDFGMHLHIIAATFIASLSIGILAVLFSPKAKAPAETCLFPALLPMIPGIYAYKTFGALAMCLFREGEEIFNHYFYLFAFNGFMTFCILLSMVVGATIPVFLLKKISFRATRNDKYI